MAMPLAADTARPVLDGWPRVALAVAAMALTGCGGVQSALAPAGDQAAAIKGVWDLMLWICGTMYVLTLIGLAAALVRGRRRAVSEGIVHDSGLNKALLGWSVLIVVLLTVLITASFITDRRIRTANADVAVRITAKQWWWQVEYLDPMPGRHFTTANELHLPRGHAVHVELQSADVIHSFWVPNLSGKHDLVPGRTNAIYLTPRVDGYFRGQCAEFCGLQHAHMGLDVVVEEPAAYKAWQEQQRMPARLPRTDRQLRGAQLFTSLACASCHRIGGTTASSRVGPDLTHLASRRTIAASSLPLDRSTLTAWIADPQHFKPGNNMPAVPLQPDEMTSLVDYLMELK